VSTTIPTAELQRRISEGELDFQGATLSGVNLQGANLQGANLRGANLRGANLHGADLKESRLVRADLGMADLGMTDLGRADLNGADFRGANLKGANFAGATVDGANLRGADLQGADLHGANLVRVDLSRADLRFADISRSELRGADLRGADLSGANLSGASLQSATLHGADLRGADLAGANLRGANLTDTRIEDANFTGSTVGSTVFADMDLRQARGLETLHHAAPSTIGTDTLGRSLGGIPESFLRGCGLALWEMLAARQYDPSLGATQAEELQAAIGAARARTRFPRKRVLIAYSRMDEPFVDALRGYLESRGVFAWRAPHEDKGTFRERQSKLAIQHDLVFILVLSRHSLQNDWADHELRLVRRLEKSQSLGILCPVSLDESWKEAPWRAKILENADEESVLPFHDWQEGDALKRQAERLLDGLALFPPPSQVG